MKPICVKCQRFYRMTRSGVPFVEQMPDGKQPPGRIGSGDPERWQPYKIWYGDLWECPHCSSQIIVGTGANPVSEHYKPDFARLIEYAGPDVIKINDC